jgi:hypothetical protein
MSEIDIVGLIEQNPISKLSGDYNNKLLKKIQETFTGFEQQLFVSSFYCYLNYDKNADFIVDLDNIWKWLGFSSKFTAIRTLETYFNNEIDYKKTTPEVGGAVFELENTFVSNSNQEPSPKPKQNGGQNRQIIMLTIKCFKSLCLKAQTKKASEIHEYYMKMEEVLHRIVEEETDELKLQLEQKENLIASIKDATDKTIQQTKKESQKAIEQAIITQFPVNTECIYIGTIDNTNEEKDTLIKFGHTNDLATRTQNHRKIYENFTLITAFRVQNKVEIENLIKSHSKIRRQMRTIEVAGKNKTELIAYDGSFTIERLTRHIKDIIHSKTYGIDNFNRLLKQNDELLETQRSLNEQLEEARETIKEQSLELKELRERIERHQTAIEVDAQMVYQNVLLPEDDLTKKFAEFIDKVCIVHPDVEEASTSMEGQFRIWCQAKPKKETFHALKNYLDTRFKASRLANQTKQQVVHGYIGVKLKEITYKKKHDNNDTENFLFQVCKFSPNGKILNSTLLSEYQRWKKSVHKTPADDDMKELKKYLNDCPYVIKATVWADAGSNEGYYGIMLKSDEHNHKATSPSGKTVEKRTIKDDALLQTWETIAKAAISENISASKMSRSIKAKTTHNDYYYCLCAQ